MGLDSGASKSDGCDRALPVNMKHSPPRTPTSATFPVPNGIPSITLQTLHNSDSCPRTRSRISRLISSEGTGTISASVDPILQCQRSDRMRAGHSGDISRCWIETNNGPPLCNGSIAVPSHKFAGVRPDRDQIRRGRNWPPGRCPVLDHCLLVFHKTKNASRRRLPATQPSPCFRPL